MTQDFFLRSKLTILYGFIFEQEYPQVHPAGQIPAPQRRRFTLRRSRARGPLVTGAVLDSTRACELALRSQNQQKSFEFCPLRWHERREVDATALC